MTLIELLFSCADSDDAHGVKDRAASLREAAARLREEVAKATTDPHPSQMEFVPCERCRERYAVLATLLRINGSVYPKEPK